MKQVLFFAIAGALFFLGRYFYFKPNYVYGESLPAFEVQILDGSILDKKSLTNNIVLLDFWGSWCGPCRQQSPSLVKLYDAYHDQSYDGPDNFEILSIGIETSKDRWLAAIRRDGKHWPWHYSSFQRFEDELAEEFGVREIPTKFLIDEKGIIVGVNPKFEDIRNYLEKRRRN
jgi:thiol-disulfide isomerase/thioredoxin